MCGECEGDGVVSMEVMDVVDGCGDGCGIEVMDASSMRCGKKWVMVMVWNQSVRYTSAPQTFS